jgi:hypothetical protein
MTNIYRADFDAAIDLLTMTRDRALAIETDFRIDDPLADFSDALEVTIEVMREQTSPDALDAMLALLNAIDR